MILNRYILILLGFCFTLSDAKFLSQNQNNGLSIDAKYGFLISHRIVMQHLVKSHASGFNLNWNIQTDGAKQWHHEFNFPEISFSIFYTSTGNKEVLGNAIGAAGGIYLPFFKKNGWSFGAKMNAGLSYLTKHYDVADNPKNNAVGSHLNGLVNLGFKVEKQFTNQSIGLHINVEHYSNGAVKLPNLGLNIPFLGLSYGYFWNNINYIAKQLDYNTEQKEKKWSFYTHLSASSKQIYPTGGNNYGILSLTNFFQYPFNKKVVAEGGIDIVYNQSLIKNYDVILPRKNNFQLGIYGMYVLPIHRVEIVLGMGRHLFTKLKPNGDWYHKLGGRFRITDRLRGNIVIKSYWAKADYFEYGLIYKWK